MTPIRIQKSTQHKPSKHKRDGGKEYRWLHYIQQCLQETEVGQLSATTVEQIPPAIAAWARKNSLESAQRAQQLLTRLVDEYQTDNPHVVLDTKPFNSAMDAWINSREQNAPTKVQDLLKWMKELRTKHAALQLPLKPDVVTMSLLVKAHAKSRLPGAASRAVQILHHMETRYEVRPNTLTYNAVLLALVHSPHRDKALQVQAIIDRMNNGTNCARPDVCSYQSLIAAWSRTACNGTPQKAEQVLEFLDRESKLPNREYLRPNVHCFTAAIHAWSHSFEHDKARRAYQILLRLRQAYQESDCDESLKPNVVAFTAALNACSLPALESERAMALSIARLLMEEVRYDESIQPNFLTYSTMLHVISTTTDEDCHERETYTRVAFQEACRAGQVGYIVLEKLQIVASPKLYQELLKNVLVTDVNGNQVVQLPASWTRNVVGERKPSRRNCKDNLAQIVAPEAHKELKRVRQNVGLSGPFSKETANDGQDDILSWDYQSL